MNKVICDKCNNEYDKEQVYSILSNGQTSYECVDEKRCNKNNFTVKMNNIKRKYEPKLNEDFIYIISNCLKCDSSNISSAYRDGGSYGKCKECGNMHNSEIEWLDKNREEYFQKAKSFHEKFLEIYKIEFDELKVFTINDNIINGGCFCIEDDDDEIGIDKDKLIAISEELSGYDMYYEEKDYIYEHVFLYHKKDKKWTTYSFGYNRCRGCNKCYE